MTTIQDAVTARLNDVAQQITAYNADLVNMLALLANLQAEQKILTTWIAANPAPVV